MDSVRLTTAILGILAAVLLASVDQLFQFTLWLYGKLGWTRFARQFEKSKRLWTAATKSVLVFILAYLLLFLSRN